MTNGYIPKHAPLLEYRIRLTPERYAMLTVPEDLTEQEAARLGRVLASVAFEENPYETATSGDAMCHDEAPPP